MTPGEIRTEVNALTGRAEAALAQGDGTAADAFIEQANVLIERHVQLTGVPIDLHGEPMDLQFKGNVELDVTETLIGAGVDPLDLTLGQQAEVAAGLAADAEATKGAAQEQAIEDWVEGVLKVDVSHLSQEELRLLVEANLDRFEQDVLQDAGLPPAEVILVAPSDGVVIEDRVDLPPLDPATEVRDFLATDIPLVIPEALIGKIAPPGSTDTGQNAGVGGPGGPSTTPNDRPGTDSGTDPVPTGGTPAPTDRPDTGTGAGAAGPGGPGAEAPPDQGAPPPTDQGSTAPPDGGGAGDGGTLPSAGDDAPPPPPGATDQGGAGGPSPADGSNPEGGLPGGSPSDQGGAGPAGPQVGGTPVVLVGSVPQADGSEVEVWVDADGNLYTSDGEAIDAESSAEISAAFEEEKGQTIEDWAAEHVDAGGGGATIDGGTATGAADGGGTAGSGSGEAQSGEDDSSSGSTDEGGGSGSSTTGTSDSGDSGDADESGDGSDTDTSDSSDSGDTGDGSDTDASTDAEAGGGDPPPDDAAERPGPDAVTPLSAGAAAHARFVLGDIGDVHFGIRAGAIRDSEVNPTPETGGELVGGGRTPADSDEVRGFDPIVDPGDERIPFGEGEVPTIDPYDTGDIDFGAEPSGPTGGPHPFTPSTASRDPAAVGDADSAPSAGPADHGYETGSGAIEPAEFDGEALGNEWDLALHDEDVDSGLREPDGAADADLQRGGLDDLDID